MQISFFLSAATPAHTNTGQDRAGQCGVRNVLQHQSEQEQQQEEQYVLDGGSGGNSIVDQEKRGPRAVSE